MSKNKILSDTPRRYSQAIEKELNDLDKRNSRLIATSAARDCGVGVSAYYRWKRTLPKDLL